MWALRLSRRLNSCSTSTVSTKICRRSSSCSRNADTRHQARSGATPRTDLALPGGNRRPLPDTPISPRRCGPEHGPWDAKLLGRGAGSAGGHGLGRHVTSPGAQRYVRDRAHTTRDTAHSLAGAPPGRFLRPAEPRRVKRRIQHGENAVREPGVLGLLSFLLCLETGSNKWPQLVGHTRPSCGHRWLPLQTR